MDGGLLQRPHSDWWRARYASLSPHDWERLLNHADERLRLGLLHNPYAPRAAVEALAWQELFRDGNMTRVLIEVASSRLVSADVLREVASWRVWEVWAVLLHNPNLPDDVLGHIAQWDHGDAMLRREYQYLRSRAKEILAERAKVVKKEVGRAP
jgi:hypothetical protein